MENHNVTIVPQGYRQGVITSITVFISFSLAFLRFYAIEGPGDWTPRSFGVLVILFLSISAQIYTLYRALRVEDNDVVTYRVTVNWFVCSVIAMMVSIILSAVLLALNPGSLVQSVVK